jgi:hypothetical protein
MKNKKGKGGRKDGQNTQDVMEEKIIKVDFIGHKAFYNPLYVKIKNKMDVFMIFTEEYKKGFNLKEEISKIKEIPIENIRLYLWNKRLIEDDATNHDQQIIHNSLLYATFKNPESNEWENINDIMNFKHE